MTTLTTTLKNKRGEMNKQSTQSYGDIKIQLNFLIFPEKGECHPAWIDKTSYQNSYVFIYHFCFDIL